MSPTTLDIISHQELSILEWLRSKDFINYFADFIKRDDAYGRLLGGVMGWHWEDEFRAVCELHGFECDKPGLNSRHDLMVNNKRVQCKFTTAKNRIDLRKNGHNEKYKPNDFDIMALNVSMNIYLVPIDYLLNKDLTEVRTSVKIDEISQFKDNYEVFNANI